MTLRARAFGLFPTAWLASVGACAYFAVTEPGVVSVAALLAMLYLLPPACFRTHNLLWPLVEGRSRLDTSEYSPWWGSHQFQVVYNAFPALEAALRLVPGAYSAWLRLWGSRIGRRVHWTPRVDITDRSLLEVGDDAVFGHLVACYAHVVMHRRERVLLYVRRIRIGRGVLLGFACRLGPGVRIDDSVVLGSRTDVFAGRRIRAGSK
jgi:acetyltransferase-like isoleucine patch superfamily enzyme